MVRSPQTTRLLLAGLATLGLTGAVALSVRDGGLWQAEPIPVPESPGPEAPEPVPQPQTGAAGARPSFDIVRVTPDGAALVAGRAAPGARVRIVADDSEIASVDTDPDGSFVAIFDAEPTAEPRALTLDAETPDGSRTVSDEAVVLLPGAPSVSAGPQDTAAGAGFSPASGAAGGSADGSADSAEPQVAATAILRPDAVEARPSTVAAGPRQVSLASISYTGEGAVTLTGAGTAGTRLRAYIDDALADEAAVAADGTWSLELADVAAGLYRLRIDQVTADGRVLSRVETPFQRDFPTLPRPRPGGGDGAGVTITVQPGTNLWTIARVHYGSGVRYTQIFTANRDLIRDPDLIYPGQVLALPGVPGGSCCAGCVTVRRIRNFLALGFVVI